MKNLLRLGQIAFTSMILLAASAHSHAQTFYSLASFMLAEGNDSFYYGSDSLVQGTDGNLYGVGGGGGTAGYGTVYKVSLDGVVTVLHSFDKADGAYPYAGLVQGANGNFYGSTVQGGAHGYGTVFEITPSGTLTTIHSFQSSEAAQVESTFIPGPNGNFYGIANSGGSHSEGSIFSVTPSGKVTVIYNFCNQPSCADGAYPQAGLFRASNGNFYGTTASGGTYQSGTVFEMTPRGQLTTLHNFCTHPNCTDGYYPYGTLIQGANGRLYGTTNLGGNGGGIIYSISLTGQFQILYDFCPENCNDGWNPFSGLLLASDGNFYSSTGAGGANRWGTAFQLTPAGRLTTLYSFCSDYVDEQCLDGGDSFSGLIQASDGNLYGTTYVGGANGDGTIYRISGITPALH